MLCIDIYVYIYVQYFPKQLHGQTEQTHWWARVPVAQGLFENLAATIVAWEVCPSVVIVSFRCAPTLGHQWILWKDHLLRCFHRNSSTVKDHRNRHHHLILEGPRVGAGFGPPDTLTDMDLHFAWQAWHLRQWIGSGGALGCGLSPHTLRKFVWRQIWTLACQFVVFSFKVKA